MRCRRLGVHSFILTFVVCSPSLARPRASAFCEAVKTVAWLGRVGLAGMAQSYRRRHFAWQSTSSFRTTPPSGAAQKPFALKPPLPELLRRTTLRRRSRRWPCRDFVVVLAITNARCQRWRVGVRISEHGSRIGSRASQHTTLDMRHDA